MNQYRNTGLVPPISNAGDGNTTEPELTTAEEIREQIESPSRNARVGALKDAIRYLVENKIDTDSHINVRQAINIRWNLPWTVVDAIIADAEPLADAEIQRREAAYAASQKKEIEYENMVAPLKAVGLKVLEIDGTYSVSGLTEEQLRLCANVLALEGVKSPNSFAVRATS